MARRQPHIGHAPLHLQAGHKVGQQRVVVTQPGAQGIAQFMPGTARRRGLDDPFDAKKALAASAAYLAELRTSFGNLGLAAAAYNAGEGKRMRSWNLPFLIRHSAFHTLDHAWEMEDRRA